VAFYTGAKALSRWPINDESTLTFPRTAVAKHSPHPIAWALFWLTIHSARQCKVVDFGIVANDCLEPLSII
jgi:hypothetical protein